MVLLSNLCPSVESANFDLPVSNLFESVDAGYSEHPGTRDAGLGVLVLLQPDYTVLLPAAKHRAAASALSSGRVLKAIAAPGAAL
jgi:hypothetical protein